MATAAPNDLPPGRDTPYATTYTPSLLQSMERREHRLRLGIARELPFKGEDAWTCYELSWLNAKGKPEAAVLRLQVPCASPCMVESKSLKLYLNSFALTRFSTRADILSTLDSDLSLAFRAPVIVSLVPVSQLGAASGTLPGYCLDDLDIATATYTLSPNVLAVDDDTTLVRETWCSHAFRSVCPVTAQPDWASIMVEYVGRRIVPETLLEYLVSFRTHAAFHENTVEQVFMDVRNRCLPEELTVYGRFLRRGGIDINPFRSTREAVAPPIRLARQ